MLFNNDMFGEIRVTKLDGVEWFCAKDIALALGYSNPRKAILDHCKGCNETLLPTNGGIQSVKIIKESDIYRLIVRSKLPSAEQFEKWVFEEVLPTIRKHGAYMTPETIEKTLTNPDFIIGLATQLKQEQQARKLAEQQKQLAQDTLLEVTTHNLTIDKFNNVLNRYIRHIAEANYHNNFAAAYNAFYDFINYKLSINVRLRKSNMVKRLSVEYLQNGKSVPKTICKKVTLCDVIRENEYDQVLQTVKSWAVELGLDITNLQKLQ